MNYKELTAIAKPHIRKNDNIPSNSFLLLSQLHIPYKTEMQCMDDFEGINPLYNTPAFLYTDKKGNKTVYFNSKTKYWNFYIFHEIAHFLLGHKDDCPQNEIDADMLACILIAPKENLPSNIKSARDISSLCQIPIDKAEMYWQEIKPNKRRRTIPLCICALLTILAMAVCIHILPSQNDKTDTAEETPAVTEQTTPHENANPDRSETTVYITNSGKKYHLPECRYIKNKTNVIECSISEAINMGYQPCKVCMGDK